MVTQVLGNRYEIQQQLGKRAGRRTLLARELTTQDLVVIKVLIFGSEFEWENLKLLEREAETLKALSHPAIPRYLDFFELDSPNGKGFALMQSYVEGKSLEEQLKAGRTFSEAELNQLAKALLEILMYLHGRQPPVIHRDIKPSNILLTNRSEHSVGEVYLIDFGSVQTLAATEGGTITVVGTYGYMPPEQFGGRTVPAFWYKGFGMVREILVTLFERVRLSINQEQMSRTYELFGFKYHRPRPARRQDISKLEVEYVGTAKIKFIIWAETQQYELVVYKHITEPELEWLAHELSDGLKLPIQVKSFSDAWS